MDLNATLAARSYDAARPLTTPAPEGGAQTQLGQFAETFMQTLAQAETQAQDVMMGRGDPHALVAALTEAQLAVESTRAVRDKVVEAYLEILRMPV